MDFPFFFVFMAFSSEAHHLDISCYYEVSIIIVIMIIIVITATNLKCLNYLKMSTWNLMHSVIY